MSINHVDFEYDSVNNIMFTDDNFQINTKDDVDEFFKLYADYMGKIGRKVNMVSKIDGLNIGAAISEYYGRRAKETVGQYLLFFARYGENPQSRMIVRTTSRQAKLESNIYTSRSQAVEAIIKLTRQAEEKTE